ncbi:hypothetical protein [Streptomyces sp. LMG1-1-1.1]|uniref:hypothetical protein n=1 Tax=Streptomyces sp. LMG1-1-1.1 TaxID=3135245 RepID=UPI0034679123
MTCALDVEETAGALERYRRRAGGLIFTGAALLPLAAGAGALLSEPWREDTVVLLCVAGILALGAGIGSLALARRMRRTLAAGTWSAHPAVALARTGHATTLVLRAPDGTETWPLTVIATRHRYEAVRPGPDGVLWWCGDPRVGGVLAPPGGGPLIWAKPLRGERVRRRVTADAAAEGLAYRPVPKQPQARPSEPLTGPDAVTTNDPATRQDSVTTTGPLAGPDAVTTNGLAAGPDALAANASVAPVGPRPFVWEDPHPVLYCGPEAEVGHDAEAGHGPGAFAPEGGDEARVASGPTYAVLAAHAERQATPQGRAPRPEADVRVVRWWRVRSLRRLAGVQAVLVALGFCVAVGAVALTGPPEEDLPKLWFAAVLPLIGLVYSGYRLLTGGRHVARLMARAATSHTPVPRRYVLLYDPHGGAPVLVFFPMHGGPDDRPEGVLPLVPPGPPKHPRRGLPERPTGPAGLHGWRDFTPFGAAFVVPWIDGRPLWPAGPYWQEDGKEFLALLDRLAPPVEAQAP